MNPLTQVKRTQQINLKEAALGIGDDASWHAKFKESPYVYAGSLPFDLTEGDLLAVFSQYGEIVDVNLVRDKGTGKSKGFAFVAYEDQKSTILAVDNLNGANVLGRTIRVDHVSNYKKKQEEDEAMEQQKREERGVCRAFQRGNCNRGDACKFSHNEQRAANTGWGAKEDNVKWGHDRHEKSGRNVGNEEEENFSSRSNDKGKRWSRVDDDEKGRKSEVNHGRREEEKEANYRDQRSRDERAVKHDSEHSRRDERYRKEEISRRHDSESNTKRDGDRKLRDDRSRRQESESNAKENCDKKGREDRSGRSQLERSREDDYDRKGGEKRPRYDEDSSSRRHGEEDRRTRR